jgi:cell volume regulation protein A
VVEPVNKGLFLHFYEGGEVLIQPGIFETQQLVQQVAIIIATGVVAGRLSQYLEVPDSLLYLLAGVLLGPLVFNLVTIPVDSAVTQLFITFGTAFILFHGGINVGLASLRQTWITISILSTLSVLVMVVVVGMAAHLILGIGWLYCFLLAAVLAPTDPTALIPIFARLKIKEKLAHTVISESAFNDATSTIVVFAIVQLIISGQYSLTVGLEKLVYVAVGGMVIGGLIGLLAGFVVSDKANHILAEYAQIITVPVVISAYLTAEHWGASGFMAVFCAGLVYELKEFGWSMADDHQESTESFMHGLSLLIRIVVFIFFGSYVDLTVVRSLVVPGLGIIGVMLFIARPLAVMVAATADSKAGWTRPEVIFMFWTRETGILPMAMAAILTSQQVRYAPLISGVVFMAVIITLLLQGSTTNLVAQKLGLLDSSSSQEVQGKK